jgi:hypothetical protein
MSGAVRVDDSGSVVHWALSIVGAGLGLLVLLRMLMTKLQVGAVIGRWIARSMLIRSLWDFLGRGGRRFLCCCLVVLIMLMVVALLILGWFVCGIFGWC